MVKFNKMLKKAQDTMGGELKDKYRVKPMFGFYRETWGQYATGKRDENIPIPIPRRHKCRVKRMMVDEDEVRMIQEEDAKKIKKKLEAEYDAGSVLDELGMGHLKVEPGLTPSQRKALEESKKRHREALEHLGKI